MTVQGKGHMKSQAGFFVRPNAKYVCSRLWLLDGDQLFSIWRQTERQGTFLLYWGTSGMKKKVS